MIYEILIELGLLFLLVYTPLAFGGVTPEARIVAQTVTGGMMMIWLLRTWSHRKQGKPQSLQLSSKKRLYSLRWISVPCFPAILCFLGLIVFQLIPLPAVVLTVLSPQSYHLYHEAASVIGSPLPRFLPVSICTQATEDALLTGLLFLALFFLVINIIQTPRQINRCLYTIIAVGILEAFSTITYVFSGKHLLPFYPATVTVGGSFVNKNHFAGYVGMIVLLVLGLILARGHPRRNDIIRKGKAAVYERILLSILWLFVLLILFFAHILSGSRGGFIGLAGGALCFTFLVFRHHLLKKWLGRVLFLLPVLLLLVVLLAPEEIFSKFDRFTGEQVEVSFRVRWEIWRTQWHIFQDFLLLGAGWGTLPHLIKRYQTFRWNNLLVYSESDFMQVLAELGIAGMIVAGWIGAAYFQPVLRQWKQRHSRRAIALGAGGVSAIVSLLIHGLVDFNLHIPANALLFTVIAALTYRIVFTHQRQYRGGS